MENSNIDSALFKLREGFIDAMRHFSEWFSHTWKHSYDQEKWSKTYAEDYPGDVYIKGYNDGVESVKIALDCFLEEELYQ